MTADRHAHLEPAVRLAVATGAHRGQRLGQREPARVEGLADDRALDVRPVRRGLGQRDEVGDLRDAAGRDDRRRGDLGDLAQQLDVRAAQRAVLAHVGDDVAGGAVALEPGEDLPEVAALARAAARGEEVVAVDDAHVEPDGHPLAVLGDRPRHPLGVAQCGGAQVDPGTAGGQRRAPAKRRRRCRPTAAPARPARRRPRRAARRWRRGRTRRRGRRGGSTRRRRAARPAPRRGARRRWSPCPPRRGRGGRPGRSPRRPRGAT